MRIVHLTASSFFGGPERQMLGLAGTLPGDYSTSFLSFAEGGRCRPFLGEARRTGFDAAELTHDFPHVRLCIRELTAFLRGNFVDVLVTHGYKSNILGRPAARAANVPIVSVSRGWTSENVKVWCYEALDRMHLRFVDRVVCVSYRQAERVLRAGVAPERIRIIRNGARLGTFESLDPSGRDRLRGLAGGDGPVILAAGRLSSEKGLRVLIEAAPQIMNAVPDARFVICGEGAERGVLEHAIQSLGLADRVRLVGFRDDLDTLIPFASVVALPSFTEGLPNIALEAGAASVPVVATAVGGNPEVVRDGVTGFLVPPGNPTALAGRLVELLQRPDWAKSLGLAGRRRMQECFTFEAQARAYGELFAEVSRSRRSLAEPACV
jgi:glycosyltransferase involved in cell wall biosynthesis